MGCFSCFKPSTSEEDPFAAETHIQEDEQLALAIHQSSLQHQEEEERRRTRELEAEERGERQNSHNSSSLENKQQDEQSLKEKDKRKQLEEHVNKDEQLAVTPPPLEEHNNNSSIAPLDEDVDGQRISLKDKGQTKPPRSMCGGCHFEIEHGGSVDVLGVPWHPQCFRCGACHIPIAIHEVQDHVLSNSRGKFHKNCYDWYCYVCEEKVKTKMFKYHQHHFWKEKYCAAHDSDGTPKCCSCERLEPRGTDFVMLDDGRWLCLECMPVSKGPTRRQNKQLTDKATESQRVVSGCPVTAILILYGLPRLLAGSIMAHEMMHAYLRLNGHNNLNKVREEGICQVLAHMWLESQRYAPNTDVPAAASSSSNAAKKGEWSELEKKLLDFYKNEIETDESEVYGNGFREVNNMVTNSSLHEALQEILRPGVEEGKDHLRFKVLNQLTSVRMPQLHTSLHFHYKTYHYICTISDSLFNKALCV